MGGGRERWRRVPVRGREDNLHELILMVSLEDFAELFEYLWCEQVGPSVDDVAHKCLRLFNIMKHLWYVGEGGYVWHGT